MPEAEEITEDLTDEEPQEETPDETADEEPQTYSRAVVDELRAESAKYRQRAREAEARADELGKQLHTALVAATGKLQDPSDLPYAAEHLESAEALSAAVDELLDAKPHLRSRVAKGDIGIGQKGTAETFSLLDALRGR